MVGPYEREQAEEWATDFENSTAYDGLAPAAKEHARQIVAEFLVKASEREGTGPGEITERGVSGALLEDMTKLALPDEARQAVPEILRGALEYLEVCGRLGGGAHLGRIVMAAASAYRARLAPGGGERVRPIVRGTTKLGRNDPCPCGSGLKYKKCCGSSP